MVLALRSWLRAWSGSKRLIVYALWVARPFRAFISQGQCLRSSFMARFQNAIGAWLANWRCIVNRRFCGDASMTRVLSRCGVALMCALSLGACAGMGTNVPGGFGGAAAPAPPDRQARVH